MLIDKELHCDHCGLGVEKGDKEILSVQHFPDGPVDQAKQFIQMRSRAESLTDFR